MKKSFRNLIFLVTILTLISSTTINTYAWDVGDLGSEDGGTILPESSNHYKYTYFDIVLPSGVGSGNVKVQYHYYDYDNWYGYAPGVSVSMNTGNTVCDFSVNLTIVDQFGIKYGLSGGASQTYGVYVNRDFYTCNTSVQNVYGSMWVCDDIGDGIITGLWYETN